MQKNSDNGSSIHFGTDGWRGVIAEDFTFENVRVVARAVARYLIAHEDIQRGLVVGYDCRFLSDRFALAAGPFRLDAQELLLVVPLIERLGLIEAFITLQPYQTHPGHAGHALGQLGFASTRWTLHQYGFAEPLTEIDDAGDPVVGQVTHASERAANQLS